MDEITVVEEIVQSLSNSEENKRYFASDLVWFNDRLSRWKNDYVHIGLVGVTSSGKSTLLNAFMGDEVLPTAIRPTSGIIVTCAKASSRQATVYYNNDRIERIRDVNLSDKLKQFGDEKYNPKNKKNVKYIDVRAPGFLFAENVQVVDSPGLDAVDMEHHEKLTMDVLLPTVDLCLYLSTLKANADLVTYEIIKAINRHDKPLIIVQNMLDSVEVKMSKGGIVEKTREQVAEEHKIRIKGIIAGIDERMACSTPVIQISARQGLIGRQSHDISTYNNSRLSLLVDIINDSIRQLNPRIKLDRLNQVATHLDGLIKQEIIKLEAELENEKQQRDLTSLLARRASLTALFDTVKKDVNSELETLKCSFSKTAKTLERISAVQLNSADKVLSELKVKAQKFEEFLIEKVNEFNNEMNQLLLDINLNPRDYLSNNLPARLPESVAFKSAQKVETRWRWREKEGKINRFKRWLAKIGDYDWGREKYEENYLVVDVDTTRQQLSNYYENMQKNITAYLNNWMQTVTQIQNVFEQELQRRHDEAKCKNDMVIDSEHRQDNIKKLVCIETNLKSMPKHTDKIQKSETVSEPPPIKNNRTRVEISQQFWGLFQVSKIILQTQFQQIFSICQQSNQSRAKKKFSQTLIWGWDDNSLINFLNRFIDQHLTESQSAALYTQGITSYKIKEHQYIVVNENNLASTMNDEIEKQFTFKHYNCYILVDVMQYGSIMKHLKTSQLVRIPNFKNCIKNWVSQSFTEYKVADNVGEWLRSLYDLKNCLDKSSQGHFLVNDCNPVYSMIMLELSGEKSINYATKVEYIRVLKDRFPYLVSSTDLEFCLDIIQGFSSPNTG